MIIDSHCHLEDRKFSRDLDRVLQRADDAGVSRLICIADQVRTSRESIALAKRYPQMKATVGLHPNNVRRWEAGTLDEIRKLAKDPLVVAIGETGLDFHYPDTDAPKQFEALRAQGQLASELGLPLVLHCRDAYPELIDFFRGETQITARGVVHCFAGTLDEAKALLDLGFFLGIGGALTYPGAQELRETIRAIGLDRIVVETDSPYLPPQKKRGRRNEPSYLKFTVRALSDLFDRTFQDVARITSANAIELYQLDADPTPALAYSLSNRLYLNVTNQCTNDCCYCERNASYCLYGHYLKLPGEPSAEQILAAIEEPERFEEFVICGLGEPTIRLDVVLELAKALKARGCRVRLNTNGHGNLIHGRDITKEFAGLLDSVAITMNAHDQATYNEISCPDDREASFDAMIDFTKKIKKVVPDVRMKVVALPEVDIEACRALAEDKLKVRFQVRPYRPHGYPEPATV